jgi:hypothetical protein
VFLAAPCLNGGRHHEWNCVSGLACRAIALADGALKHINLSVATPEYAVDHI